MKFPFALTVAAILGTSLGDVDPIIIKGSKFFYVNSNTQFYIRGVAYQQDYHGASATNTSDTFRDPLADPTACKRDIPILRELHTNTIRVYAINPHSNHKECMNMLGEAGIYVICDLSDPSHSIDRINPHWETGLYSRYVNVIDEMAQYNNTLGFFAGNEVANSATTTNSSAFVKAAVRDMKAYIKKKHYRPMGVGYATNDDAEIRVNMANYFNCDGIDEAVDFWGYNVYSWCGDSSYEMSGYKDRTDEFRNYSVPVFLAEYGCNAVQPRRFTEIDALYRNPMDEVWSGGIIYMYFQEVNNYGLVSAIDDNKVSKLPDFGSYAQRIVSANPYGVNKDSYTVSNTVLEACPTVGQKWEAAATPLPPTPDIKLCECMTDAASCVVSDSVPSSKYGELFHLLCGITDCSDITANSSDGKYGDYSMCEPRQQLNVILNKYYHDKGSDANVCYFDGAATTKKPSRDAKTCHKKGKKEKSTSTTVSTATDSSETSSTSPCSCTCYCMGADSVTPSRSRGGSVANPHADVGASSFGLYIITVVVTVFGMALL